MLVAEVQLLPGRSAASMLVTEVLPALMVMLAVLVGMGEVWMPGVSEASVIAAVARNLPAL